MKYFSKNFCHLLFFTVFTIGLSYGQKNAEILPEGVVLPRVNNADRNGFSIKKTGQSIFNIEENCLQYVDGGNNWRSLRYNWLSDSDNDTYVTTEFVFDEDWIRMDVDGMQGLWIRENTQGILLFENRYQAGSLFLGGGGNGLNADPSAFNNTIIGAGSGFSIIGGFANTVLGSGAFSSNDAGDYNVSIGAESMQTGTDGNRNIAIGNRTMVPNQASDNIAIGHRVMENNDVAFSNLAMGSFTLNALTGVATSNFNTIIGHQSAIQTSTISETVSLGTNILQGFNTQVSKTVAIGNNALQSINISEENTVMGYSVGSSLTGTARYNILIGNDVLKSSSNANDNVVIGVKAMELSTTNSLTGNGPLFNVALGNYSLRRSFGKNSVAIGGNAMTFHEDGTGNTAVGVESMVGHKLGSRNTSLGFGTMQSNQNGSENTAIGAGAGAFSNGDRNVFIGLNAGSTMTGDDNFAIANSGTKNLIEGNFANDEITLNNIVNLTPRSTVPPSPNTGCIYMDDGTNTAGVPTLRVYINAVIGWKDL